MTTLDHTSEQNAPPEESATYREPFGALAAHIQRASTGDRAALARLKPEAPQPHQLAALARALTAAGLAAEQWHTDTWPRWALIAHGMALAGHDGKQKLGRQLAHAGVPGVPCVSESRVTKLLTSRGDAFTQLLPRVLRLMASKGVAPNWRELGELVLKEGSSLRSNQADAEAIRLQIAGPYFSTLARAESKS